MSNKEYKSYIIIQLEKMDESDNRFLRQLCALIKRYIEGKRGH